MKNSFFIKLLAVMTFLFVSLFTVEVKAIDYTSGKYSVGGIFYGDTLGEEITYMNMEKDGTIYDAFCLNHEYKYCRNSKTYTSIANSSYEAKGLGSLVAYFYESCGRSNGTTTGLSCENWAQYAIWEIITYYTNNGKIPPSGTTLSSSLSTAHNGNETTFMEKISAINEEYLKIASPSNYCITITAPNGNTKDFCMKYETSDSYYKCDGSIDILKYNDTGTCEGSVTSSYYQLMATYNGSCTKNPKTGGLKIVKKSESGKLLPGAQFKISSTKSDCSDNDTIYTTDSTGSIVINDLNPGVYHVCEIKAPMGYKIIDKSKDITISSSSTESIEFKNTPLGSIIVRKVDSYNNKLLSGATIALYKAGCKEKVTDAITGKTIENQVTNSQGEVIFANLPLGSYCIVEVSSPNRYQNVSNAIKYGNLTVKQDNIKIAEDNTTVSKMITMKNEPLGNMVIEKQDKVSGKLLNGAQFELYKCDSNYKNCEVVTEDANGVSITKKTKVGSEEYYYLYSDNKSNSIGTSNGKILINDLLYGYYAVVEVVAPTDGKQGYKIIREKIKVGELNDTSNTCGGELLTPCSKIIVKDEPINIKIIKFAMKKTGEKLDEKLTGVTFQIYEYGSTDILNEVIISSIDGVTIGIKPGRYVIKEISSPSGYSLMDDDIVFEVSVDGVVTIEKNDYVSVSDNTINFYNKPSNLVISKQDITNGKELPGATLYLSCDNGYNTSWISSDTPYEFDIQPGVTCKLKETASPEGYEVELNELEFKLDDNGNVISLVNLGNDSNWKIESNRIVLYNGFKVPATASLISIIAIILGLGIIGGGITFIVIAGKRNNKQA